MCAKVSKWSSRCYVVLTWDRGDDDKTLYHNPYCFITSVLTGTLVDLPPMNSSAHNPVCYWAVTVPSYWWRLVQCKKQLSVFNYDITFIYFERGGGALGLVASSDTSTNSRLQQTKIYPPLQTIYPGLKWASLFSNPGINWTSPEFTQATCRHWNTDTRGV